MVCYFTVLTLVLEEEAMWIRFKSEKQFAIKIYVGNVNAVSGEPAIETEEVQLRRIKKLIDQKSLQDYIITPQQRWLDGIAIGSGKVRQFVAVRTGSGYTVEAQITGKENVAGLSFEITRKKYVFNKTIRILSEEEYQGGASKTRIASIQVDPDMLVQEFIRLVQEAAGKPFGRGAIWTWDKESKHWKSLESIDLNDDPLEDDYTRTLEHYNLGGKRVRPTARSNSDS